jgi:hypothetical protein
MALAAVGPTTKEISKLVAVNKDIILLNFVLNVFIIK